MKKNISAFLFLGIVISGAASAQLVGTEAFLQGRFLEVGMCSNAAFGTTTSPAGYHPHLGFGGSNLASVYDYGHDGWTVGAPPYMGDYSYPGSPFEGWEIQANGTRSQQYASPAYASPYVYSGACTMTGAGITGYSNSGGQASATWMGNFNTGGATLAINANTRIDTNASWVVVTVKLHNTSSAMANNVYYFRSVDPDNDETWPGGGFNTDNWVTYQNDSNHRVVVSAVGYSGAHPYYGLGTIDARAVALVYNSWGLSVTQDLAALWNRTYSPASYVAGVHDPGDIAIGVVFNLGNIAPGDSTLFSYAYLYKDSLDVDSIMGLSGGDTSHLDSFRVLRTNTCTGISLTAYDNNYVPGLTMRTQFGDGTPAVTTPMPLYVSYGHSINAATITHHYLTSGTYTVKQVLLNGTTRLDSLVRSWHYQFCNEIHVNFYYDANNDCGKETTEPYIFQPFLTEVDSNGVPVDTVSSISGFYYKAYGAPGDVYTFRVLHAPAGLYISCPSTAALHDTLCSPYVEKTLQFGSSCGSGSGHDLQVFTSFRAGTHHFGGSIIVDNTMCAPISAALTAQLSPKYPGITASPSPASVSGTTASWNFILSDVMTSPAYISLNCEKGSGPSYSFGDTVNSTYSIDPVSGDVNPADNICIRNDTVKSGYDPNYMDVSPDGYISAGANLTYSIGFENTGNDTAYNIFILDTLPAYLDATSVRMVAASAYMDVTCITSGGQTILRFEFPNINLPDSSHHNQNTGLVIFSANTLTGLAAGTVIQNSAGVYFDDNPVVYTDTAIDVIAGIPTLHVGNSPTPQPSIFPNPATSSITIKADPANYTYITITNTLGETLLQQPVTTPLTELDVKALPAGVYYVLLKGTDGNVVRKLVKM